MSEHQPVRDPVERDPVERDPVERDPVERDPVERQGALDALHHVALQVEDIARAVAWYQERFRCEVAWRDESWALLRFANTSLALVIPGQHPPHVAFSSPHAERYGELKGHRDGTRSVYVRDSEGNVVEVMDEQSL